MPCSSQLSPRPFRHHLYCESAPPLNASPRIPVTLGLPCSPENEEVPHGEKDQGQGGPEAEVGEHTDLDGVARAHALLVAFAYKLRRRMPPVVAVRSSKLKQTVFFGPIFNLRNHFRLFGIILAALIEVIVRIRCDIHGQPRSPGLCSGNNSWQIT